MADLVFNPAKRENETYLVYFPNLPRVNPLPHKTNTDSLEKRHGY